MARKRKGSKVKKAKGKGRVSRTMKSRKPKARSRRATRGKYAGKQCLKEKVHMAKKEEGLLKRKRVRDVLLPKLGEVKNLVQEEKQEVDIQVDL